MNQNPSIKYFFLFRWCLLLVLSSFISSQVFFTRNQLIGKENPDIIGNSKMHKEVKFAFEKMKEHAYNCLLYTSPSPRDRQKSRMPSSA